MWLIVGLGNPGEEYVNTRHNIGFDCVKAFADRHGLDFSKKQSKARVAEGHIAGQRVALAKPFTFMNLSGQAVVGLCNWYKINPAENLVVIYDDMDLPFGSLRLRERGSPGSHNGMKSIVSLLGNQVFPRIRFGIGNGPAGRNAANYVLGRFTREEQAQIQDPIDRTCDALEMIIRDGFQIAMNRYNVNPKPNASEG
jgi:PTH1 family peptidyl-tRNA hydrolase